MFGFLWAAFRRYMLTTCRRIVKAYSGRWNIGGYWLRKIAECVVGFYEKAFLFGSTFIFLVFGSFVNQNYEALA
jgi:hypothetical protein